MLTAAELGQLARTRSAELSQHSVVVVRGRLTITPDFSCLGGARCTKAEFVGGGGGFVLQRQNPLAAETTGAYAMRFTSRLDGGQPIVEILGVLSTPAHSELAWPLDGLRSPTSFADDALVAVDAWLVRSPFHSCPSPHVLSGCGCPTDDWLTPSSYQPLRSDGSSVEPSDGIVVESGDYGSFAPDPAPFGRDNVGVVPRRAEYVVRLVNFGCPDTAYCGGDIRYWKVIGRVSGSPQPGSANGLESVDPATRPARPGPIPFPVHFGKHRRSGFLIRCSRAPRATCAPEVRMRRPHDPGGNASLDSGPVATLTARRLNRASLARQLLLRRERLDVIDAVRRVVALQAQEPASPYLALWNRIAGVRRGRPRCGLRRPRDRQGQPDADDAPRGRRPPTTRRSTRR